MTVFRPPVFDADHNPVTISDVGPIDHPSQPHPHPSVCEVPDCWALSCRAWEWQQHLEAVAE